MRILIMGLSGAGKTALVKELVPPLNAVFFNADVVRKPINPDLGFLPADRGEQARRIGWMCDRVVKAGGTAIDDFTCTTRQARTAFGKCFIIWVNRVNSCSFENTNALFQPPRNFDLEVTDEGSPCFWATKVLSLIRTTITRCQAMMKSMIEIHKLRAD